MTQQWMLYGATGYTGRLLAAFAVENGHRPILAARNAARLQPLADELGLPWRAVSLDQPDALRAALADVGLVFHAAGPFVHTSRPMVRACLATQTHYLDITGEIAVFLDTLAQDSAARAAGVTLISGVGFDVIPTDCLARYVADQVPDAVTLDIGICALGRASAGTTTTALESAHRGNRVRRNGRLERIGYGEGTRPIAFSHRDLVAMPIPWGDLATAYRTTGIPNITTYMSFPPSMMRQLRRTAPLVGALRLKPLRRLLQAIVARTVDGPDADMRRNSRSYIWARAADANGNAAEAWLDTMEGYRLTVVGGLKSVEAVLAQPPVGALTPALAFGADFVLTLPDTVRYDTLAAARAAHAVPA